MPSPKHLIPLRFPPRLELRGGGGGSGGAGTGFLQRQLIKDVLEQGFGPGEGEGRPVVVCGWARTVRVQGAGAFAFIELNDGSCFRSIQVIADKGLPGWDAIAANPHTHTSWRISGVLVPSPGAGQALELRASEVRLLGAAPPEGYSLAKGRLPLEHLRGVPHLRPRTNTLGAVARLRHALGVGLEAFFDSKGFIKVHTPIVTASDCEGAGQMFSVSTLLGGEGGSVRGLNASTGKVEYGADFFKKPAFLTVSGQLQAEAYAVSLGRVYTFGPTFRAEESHTQRHLAEFWMLEPEMSFADLKDDMDCAEAMLKHAVAHALEALPQDLEFFDSACAKKLPGFTKGALLPRLKQIVEQPFARMSYGEAVEKLLASGHKFEALVEWGRDLSTEHEKYLTEEIVKGPVIVYDYPKGIKAFYMRANEDGKTVAAMDVLFPKCGEIIGGSQREERLDLMEARMIETGINPHHLSWYTDLRRFGGVPHAGFGLGFERLVMFVSGLENIRDVIPFPRFPGHALC